MKKAPLLVTVVLLASTLSAGCLSIEWVRDSFLPASEYETIILENYTNVSYTFTTDVQDPDSLVFNTAQDIIVQADSLDIDLRVMVTIDNLPVPVDIADMLEMLGVEREVNVSLYKPDGKEYFNKAYNATTPHPDQWAKVPSPETGIWRLVVRSEGIGHPSLSYHDSFSIVVIVRTPKVV